MDEVEKDGGDLPLCSNTNEILVNHYNFQWHCDFERKLFTGHVTLFLNAVGDKSRSCVEHEVSCSLKREPFCFVLDCKDIEIINVKEITSDGIGELLEGSDSIELNFKVDSWSLKIWKETSFCAFCFPKIVRITYQTKEAGKSLLWVKDQDDNPCVYTYGAWVNNRSLFPCQEPPNAMATWEATIKVHESLTVLTSGDEHSQINLNNGFKQYYFCTKSVLPMSTLAIAVGYWKCKTIDVTGELECRLFASNSLIDQCYNAFSNYIPNCFEATRKHMGAYPFPRVDFLIVPPGFGSLGMASPNIVFLSQSTLTRDGSMNVRLAHELAHSWFGLLIGAKDWTEEWLSEGFATYLEDVFHSTTMKFEDPFSSDYKELRCWIRAQTLKAEVENTIDELQTLRPTKGQDILAQIDERDAKMVKNGMNSEKGFLQVHYIKGYFLLKYLSNLVGENSFMEFLRNYVEINKGKLVDSKEFLEFFFTTFPNIKEETIESLTNDWLDSPGIPEKLDLFTPSGTNSLYNDAITQIQVQEQLVIILENLLNHESAIPVAAFKELKDKFSLADKNPEVRHRWCELITKHKIKIFYDDVENFIQNDLAMGIYLYGELINSGNASQRNIASKCFHQLKDEMEPNFKIEINKMFNL